MIWASAEFGFVALADAYSTGSSLMPQKKNPDSLELVRGKGARLLGRLTGFLSCLRSLPLAYNKDLQEDKEALFEALDTWEACLEVCRLVVDSAEIDVDACHTACGTGYLDATDLAEYLVQRGVPFRDAHDQVGRLVRLGIDRGVELGGLPLESMQEICPEIEDGVFDALDIDQNLERRSALGSCTPKLVRAAARRVKKQLERERSKD